MAGQAYDGLAGSEAQPATGKMKNLPRAPACSSEESSTMSIIKLDRAIRKNLLLIELKISCGSQCYTLYMRQNMLRFSDTKYLRSLARSFGTSSQTLLATRLFKEVRG